MTAIIILLILIFLIFLLCRVTVGIDAQYFEDSGLRFSAILIGRRIQIFPKTKQKPKKTKNEHSKRTEQEPKKEKKRKKSKLQLSIELDDIIDLLKCLVHGLGKFGHINVDRFVFHFLAAGPDPYATAILFGKVNAVLSAILPLTKERYHTKEVDVFTDVDYMGEHMRAEGALALTIRLGQVFSMINALLFGGIRIGARILIRSKRAQKQQKNNDVTKQDEEVPVQSDEETERKCEDGN